MRDSRDAGERGPTLAQGADYRGFDARDEENGRGPLILALAIGVLLVFGAVVWNAYRQGIRTAGEPPLIAASDSPFKRPPDNMDRPDRAEDQISAYNQLDGTTPPEEPIEPANVREEMVALPGDLDGASPMESGVGGPEGPLDLRPSGTEDTSTEDTSSMGSVPPAVSEPVEPNVLPEAPRFEVDPGGNFLVQVSASQDRSDVERLWRQLNEANDDILGGAEPDYQRADLGAKGVWYRLRISAFPSRTEASRFCDTLKTRRQDCFVVSR